MFEAGSIIWRIQTVGKDVLKQDLAQSEAAAQKAGQALDKTGKKAEELGNKSATAAPKVRTVGQEIFGMSEKAQQAAATVGGTLLVVGGAIVAIGAAVAKTGIDYNTLQQTTRAALTTLLGSAEAANAQMDQLDDFARNSPFAKQVFIQAQQQMLGFGVATKDVIPALDAIQNAVAAMGGSNQQISALSEILSEVKSEGRLSGDALQRLGHYGIDAAQIIGSQMNKTSAEIRDMASRPGGIPVDQIWDPLVNGLQEKFGGAAANVKATFAGAMDRVKAAWRDTSADLMRPLVDPNGGGALIDLLNWTADLMRAFQALPGPVKDFTGVLFLSAGGIILAGGVALLAVPKIVAFRDAVAKLSKEMPGAVGGAKNLRTATLALTGVAILAWLAQYTGGLIDSARESAGLKQTTDSLKKSLDEVGTKKTVDLVAGEGLNTLAALTNGGFFSDLNKGIQQSLDGISDWNVAFKVMGVESNLVTNKLATLDQTMADLVASGDTEKAAALYKELASRTDGSEESLDRLNQLLPQYSSLQKGATEKTQNATDAYMDAQNEINGFEKELDQLIDALNKANGVGQDAITTNAAYQGTLVDVAAEVAAYAAANRVSVEAINEHTAAGSANQEMFAGLAKDASDAAVAQFEYDLKTMSAKDATEKYLATVAGGRKVLYDQILAITGNADAAQTLTDKIYAVPTQHQTDMIVETASAQTVLNNFFNRWNGATINLRSTVSGRLGSGILGEADGGVVNYFAGGGMRENHVAQFARAGDVRVWAEPETDGETYIPHAIAKRGRSTQILAQTADEFGYQLVPKGAQSFADGGRTASNPGITPRAAPGVTNNFNGPIGANADDVIRKIQIGQRRAQALFNTGGVGVA